MVAADRRLNVNEIYKIYKIDDMNKY